MLRVGIQGDRGSACDFAATQLVPDLNTQLVYLTNADNVLSKLRNHAIDQAVLAIESPQGSPIIETQNAINKYGAVSIIKELLCEVHHKIIIRKGVSLTDIKFVASHPIPLNKHKEILRKHFPHYQEIVTEDTGVAAQDLASGKLPNNTAVIAMLHAAEVFKLVATELELPANENYLTLFALVKPKLSTP
jgi:prephenate dehydratase